MHERRRRGGNRWRSSAGQRADDDPGPQDPRVSPSDADGDLEVNVEMGVQFARWGFATFVATVALTGLLILAAVIAVALEPPGWLQLLLGVVLAVGSAALAWLIASAFRSRDGDP